MKNMTPTAVSQVAEQIVHVVVSIVMVLILRSKGIVWAVAGASIGTAVGALIALLIVIKYYKQYEHDYKVLRKDSELPSNKILEEKKQVLRILHKQTLYTYLLGMFHSSLFHYL